MIKEIKWRCVICGGQGIDDQCINCGASKEESDETATEPDNLDWQCPGRER